jgi:hypothetical protein
MIAWVCETPKTTRRGGHSIVRLGERSVERRLYVSYSKGYNGYNDVEILQIWKNHLGI